MCRNIPVLIFSRTSPTLETRPSLISSRAFPPPPSPHPYTARQPFAPCLHWLAVKHDVCALTRFRCSTSGMRSDWPPGWHLPRSRHFSIMSSVVFSASCSPTACFFFPFYFLFDCLPLFCVPRRLWCFSVVSFNIKERLPAVHPCAFSHHTWLSSSFVPHGYFQPRSLGFLSSFSIPSSSSSSDVPHFQTISLS